MSLFLENSFPLNNYISISKKIQKIPLFFIHFLPIDNFKNMDKHYKLLPESNSNIVQREIKYKLIQYGNYVNKNIDYSPVFSKDNFSKSLYHIFYSCSLLHKHDMSFTLSTQPFITCDDTRLPILHDFSYSFYFPSIHMDNLKMYFSSTLLQNTYISIDIFIITYLLQHPTDCLCHTDTDDIVELFTERREKIDKKNIYNHISYFHNYNSQQIIQYLLQFKYTWTYYSLCYYFIIQYPDLLKHFSLYESFHTYIHSSFKERHSDIVQMIHRSLFE
jgi:hypothetical protein